MAERADICACGHSYFDHCGSKYGEFADLVRERTGKGDCERGSCVCAGWNPVVSIVDARKFRGAPDPVLNAGANHPLTKNLRKYVAEGGTPEWLTLMCDRCYVTDLTPDKIVPWMSWVLCPECFGQTMTEHVDNRLVAP